MHVFDSQLFALDFNHFLSRPVRVKDLKYKSMLPPKKLCIFDELILDIGGHFPLEVQTLTLLHIAEGAEAESISFVNLEHRIGAGFDLLCTLQFAQLLALDGQHLGHFQGLYVRLIRFLETAVVILVSAAQQRTYHTGPLLPLLGLLLLIGRRKGVLLEVIKLDLCNLLEEVLTEHKHEILLHTLPVHFHEDVLVLLPAQQLNGADEVPQQG